MMKKENPIILTYGDATIRKSDQDCLKEGQWLNDNCISFYFEYLTNEFKNEDVLFLDPSSMAFMYFETEMEDILETFAPLHFEKRKYIIIPINDKDDKHQAVGGSHWALLLYVVEGDYFVYFDSTSGIIPSSHDIAMKVYAIRHETMDPIEEEHLQIAHYKNAPQQQNGYDCGVYVLAVAERLAEFLLKEKKTLEDKPEELGGLKPSVITEKRKKIYELISQLAAKKQGK